MHSKGKRSAYFDSEKVQVAWQLTTKQRSVKDVWKVNIWTCCFLNIASRRPLLWGKYDFLCLTLPPPKEQPRQAEAKSQAGRREQTQEYSSCCMKTGEDDSCAMCTNVCVQQVGDIPMHHSSLCSATSPQNEIISMMFHLAMSSGRSWDVKTGPVPADFYVETLRLVTSMSKYLTITHYLHKIFHSWMLFIFGRKLLEASQSLNNSECRRVIFISSLST